MGVISLVATDIFGLLIPILTKQAIDSLAPAPSRGLWFFPCCLVAAAIGQAIFRYYWRQYLFGATHLLEYDLRNDFLRRLLHLPLRFFKKYESGDILSRAISDLSAVRQFTSLGFLGMVDGFLMTAATLGLMLSLSVRLTIWCVAPMAVVTVIVVRMGPRIRDRFAVAQAALSAISSHTHESIAGIKVVQAYAQESRQIARFELLAKDYLEKNIALAKVHAQFEPMLSLVAGVCGVLVLLNGGREIIWGRLTVGGLAGFMGYLAMLAWPMTALGVLVNQYQRGRAAMFRLREILDEPEESSQTVEAVRQEWRGTEIQIKELTFVYKDEPVLKGVTLSMSAGSWSAIIGKTGSGKSTLAHLLVRLYEPPVGAVWIGGADVRKIPHDILRRRIGFVSQDIFLFSESITENIRMGHPEALEDMIEKAMVDAGLDSDIEQLEARGNTLVGERGVALSGGQRQRSEIARALLRNPDILILDDAFSNVDVSVEEKILKRLREVRKNKTTIIISHRYSTVASAEQIWILDQGRVIDQGSPQELLRRDNFFSALYKQQGLE